MPPAAKRSGATLAAGGEGGKMRVCPGGGMAYTADLKSAALMGMWVRPPPRALNGRADPVDTR